jgi:hypothetical protein
MTEEFLHLMVDRKQEERQEEVRDTKPPRTCSQ